MRLLLLAAALAATPAAAAPALAPIWSDHAVIQRDRPIVIEGSAAPNEALTVTLGTAKQSLRADADGHFRATFPARPASFQPVKLGVANAAGEGASAGDLLIGDVWLCSGQSNMEFSVDRGLDAWTRIQSSSDPRLRFVTIPQFTAAVPAADFGKPTQWALAGPDTVGGFSAACFYMAQKLRRDLDVPIGAIASDWGGSQARAWLAPGPARKLYGDAEMDLLALHGRDPLAAVTRFAPVWQDWWRGGSGGQEPWRDPDQLDWHAVPKISPWTEWTGTPLATHATGNVWLRRTIDLTAEQAAKGGTLHIGVIDDLDMSFVNGRPVGNSFGWSAERHYAIPADYLRAGKNEILVVASNSWGSGGFTSPADRLSFAVTGGETIPLADGWRYAIGAIEAMPPRAPWDANAGIGVMHNRMIAPIGGIALAGAAWYQGESDVGTRGYRDRLAALFAGWRAQFGSTMRMLVVQLANFETPADRPVASGWADLREDQRQAVLADPNAALVTAIDLGERIDIHPANKIELGDRLALAAEGKALPMPAAATREGTAVRVTFTGVEGGLHAWSGAPLGLELCGDTQDSCRYAAATIDGDSLLLAGDGRPATRVRHAWADYPVVNLYDVRPQPLPGFELAIAP